MRKLIKEKFFSLTQRRAALDVPQGDEKALFEAESDAELTKFNEITENMTCDLSYWEFHERKEGEAYVDSKLVLRQFNPTCDLIEKNYGKDSLQQIQLYRMLCDADLRMGVFSNLKWFRSLSDSDAVVVYRFDAIQDPDIEHALHCLSFTDIFNSYKPDINQLSFPPYVCDLFRRMSDIEFEKILQHFITHFNQFVVSWKKPAYTFLFKTKEQFQIGQEAFILYIWLLRWPNARFEGLTIRSFQEDILEFTPHLATISNKGEEIDRFNYAALRTRLSRQSIQHEKLQREFIEDLQKEVEKILEGDYDEEIEEIVKEEGIGTVLGRVTSTLVECYKRKEEFLCDDHLIYRVFRCFREIPCDELDLLHNIVEPLFQWTHLPSLDLTLYVIFTRSSVVF